jgi:hypothetical protein
METPDIGLMKLFVERSGRKREFIKRSGEVRWKVWGFEKEEDLPGIRK